jgi:nucleoside-diphosphate kinase
MAVNKKKLEEIYREKTVVLFKPDTVIRGIIGELISRFERKGLKISAMKLVWASEELAGKHYVDSEEWLLDTGKKSYNSYLAQGVTPEMTPRELALDIRRKLIDHLTAGPVVAMVLEGAHSIESVRKMRGSTSPLAAEVGTIGFDYTLESYELSDAGDWAIKNLIHASDSLANAERELGLWFKPEEILDYRHSLHDIIYANDWFQEKK